MKFFPYIGFCFIILLLASCSKMDKGYADFIKNGPVIYPGRPDTVVAFAGRDRIKLQWVLANDQTITSCKVFWNLGIDSLVMPVTTTARPDTFNVLISNLAEGSQGFVVNTYDKDGHKSVGTETIGSVYGTIYMSTVINRPVRTVTKEAAKSKISIAWVGIEPGCLGTQWNYTGSDQAPKQFFSPVGDSTFLNGIDVAKPVSYRSLFIPEKNAIDTFYTDYKSL